MKNFFFQNRKELRRLLLIFIEAALADLALHLPALSPGGVGPVLSGALTAAVSAAATAWMNRPRIPDPADLPKEAEA